MKYGTQKSKNILLYVLKTNLWDLSLKLLHVMLAHFDFGVTFQAPAGMTTAHLYTYSSSSPQLATAANDLSISQVS